MVRYGNKLMLKNENEEIPAKCKQLTAKGQRKKIRDNQSNLRHCVRPLTDPRSIKPIKVFYNEQQVGDYYADIIVDDSIILDLKAMEAICEEHEFQLINYLKATEIEIGLLLNFGKKPEFKRKIYSNIERG